MSTTDPLEAITHFIVIHNPHSTRAKQARGYIEQLRARYQDKQLTVLETVSADIAPNRDLLKGALQSPASEALIVLGGDGTWRLVGAALVDPLMPVSVRTVLLVKLPGGNADDSFRSLHARRWHGDPLGILDHAQADRRVVRVHPLVCTTLTAGKQSEHIGMGYITFGTTAQATVSLNDSQYRRRRQKAPRALNQLQDIIQTFPGMLSFPERFTARMQDGSVRQIAEMQLVNGPIMAENGKYPMRLSDDALHFAVITPNDPFTVLFTALRMSLRLPPGKRTSKPVQFTIISKNPVAAQVDGECFSVPSGSNVTISRSPLSLRVLATKPA